MCDIEVKRLNAGSVSATGRAGAFFHTFGVIRACLGQMSLLFADEAGRERIGILPLPLGVGAALGGVVGGAALETHGVLRRGGARLLQVGLGAVGEHVARLSRKKRTENVVIQGSPRSKIN